MELINAGDITVPKLCNTFYSQFSACLKFHPQSIILQNDTM